ncbi:hypothetical protein RFI_24425 [Reticulomyxa filosa]|uniref:Uncharacterized protein n=1 Tax=Reticulomyxa filosa TaxID=46433 RepID=X6MHQ9_RETFI|nr:hypothetical protein RFI_24425 [Reticulomyxa filosa]|eukprot:ETO12952.1 hypothetical protein RFI_24425 [Reticulomyxa filosa]
MTQKKRKNQPTKFIDVLKYMYTKNRNRPKHLPDLVYVTDLNTPYLPLGQDSSGQQKKVLWHGMLTQKMMNILKGGSDGEGKVQLMYHCIRGLCHEKIVKVSFDVYCESLQRQANDSNRMIIVSNGLATTTNLIVTKPNSNASAMIPGHDSMKTQALVNNAMTQKPINGIKKEDSLFNKHDDEDDKDYAHLKSFQFPKASNALSINANTKQDPKKQVQAQYLHPDSSRNVKASSNAKMAHKSLTFTASVATKAKNRDEDEQEEDEQEEEEDEDMRTPENDDQNLTDNTPNQATEDDEEEEGHNDDDDDDDDNDDVDDEKEEEEMAESSEEYDPFLGDTSMPHKTYDILLFVTSKDFDNEEQDESEIEMKNKLRSILSPASDINEPDDDKEEDEENTPIQKATKKQKQKQIQKSKPKPKQTAKQKQVQKQMTKWSKNDEDEEFSPINQKNKGPLKKTGSNPSTFNQSKSQLRITISSINSEEKTDKNSKERKKIQNMDTPDDDIDDDDDISNTQKKSNSDGGELLTQEMTELERTINLLWEQMQMFNADNESQWETQQREWKAKVENRYELLQKECEQWKRSSFLIVDAVVQDIDNTLQLFDTQVQHLLSHLSHTLLQAHTKAEEGRYIDAIDTIQQVYSKMLDETMIPKAEFRLELPQISTLSRLKFETGPSAKQSQPQSQAQSQAQAQAQSQTQTQTQIQAKPAFSNRGSNHESRDKKSTLIHGDRPRYNMPPKVGDPNIDFQTQSQTSSITNVSPKKSLSLNIKGMNIAVPVPNFMSTDTNMETQNQNQNQNQIQILSTANSNNDNDTMAIASIVKNQIDKDASAVAANEEYLPAAVSATSSASASSSLLRKSNLKLPREITRMEWDKKLTKQFSPTTIAFSEDGIAFIGGAAVVVADATVLTPFFFLFLI